MIQTFRHKGLKLFWEKDDKSKLPANHISKIRLILTLLNAAKVAEDVNFPGSDFHGLKGDLAGFYAVKVTGNYRIIFQFSDGDAFDIGYVDYH
ncbi:type II toxin-antitoxin system RelE/ParE family toxin [Sphingobacterium paludis]|uniref:Proteic killer suppression protein n=1 Tax=Sphingobacterium paludis TaxID=1476465 RepID=A0A4R7CTP3_9SPHI|nr:type II toxin-antitoxin system RelE/ParE family toxin [Sphingobacterium paludis]TDS11793.1 proteic killer suppression protein [Sphingobacterium paludis]